MSRLLRNTHPLVVDPELATILGLCEAIILQQIHYWIVINQEAGRNYEEGYYWTYNSLPSWQAQFPFWSPDTIKRTMSRLEAKNLLIIGQFNRSKFDRTKWYRINYLELESLAKAHGCRSGQFAPMDKGNLHPPIPETIPENSPPGKNDPHKPNYDPDQPVDIPNWCGYEAHYLMRGHLKAKAKRQKKGNGNGQV